MCYRVACSRRRGGDDVDANAGRYWQELWIASLAHDAVAGAEAALASAAALIEHGAARAFAPALAAPSPDLHDEGNVSSHGRFRSIGCATISTAWLHRRCSGTLKGRSVTVGDAKPSG